MNRACDTCKSFMNPFDRYICESCIRNDHYSPAPKAFWKTGFDKYKYNEEEMAMVKLSKPPMVPISIERNERKMTRVEMKQELYRLANKYGRELYCAYMGNEILKVIIYSDNTIPRHLTIHPKAFHMGTIEKIEEGLLNNKKTISDKVEIKKVIFNDPATIVLWSDNTKTVVKADGEIFDQEKGLAMAIAKKALGNEGNYFEVFKKWVKYREEFECPFHELAKAASKATMSMNEVASVLATGDK